jgi:heavy metal translocating P-type ATPase
MILEIGILFATYVGVRLYENYSQPPKNEGEGNRVKKLKKSVQTQSTEMVVSDTDKQRDIKISVVSMGLAAIRQFIYSPLAPLSFGLYLYTTLPYLKRAEKVLVEQRKLNVDVLFVIADMMALAINQYFAAAFSIWLFHQSKYTTAKVKKQSEEMLVNVFDQKPSKVWVLQDNIEIEVPLDQVKVNDILVVNTGEVVAVDGLIVEGMAAIDQHALTGESRPVEKGVGDRVFASSFLIAGKIKVKVEKSGMDTTIAKIGQILMHSTDFKSTVQLKGEQWADKASLPMLGIAGALWPILGTANTVVFLYSHIGNRIRILAPLGTLNHISLAAHNSILIKDGRALELLMQVDTVLFDKTGTLTNEQPEVRQIIACDNYQEEEILTYAAAAERKFTHPIAKAILKKAEQAHLSLPEIEDSKYQVGYGITVRLFEKTIQVGSVRFMSQEGVQIPTKLETAVADSLSNRYSLVMVAVNHQVIGVIELQASVRAEVKSILSGLRRCGVKHIAIVSGDHKQPTQSLAEELGMDSYFYDVLPQNKAQIVEQLQKNGQSVCFVGDGINDAIAMKKANVSVSLTGATSCAIDVADVVLMDGSLSHLAELFEISKKLNTNLQESLALTFGPTVVNISSAFFLHFGVTATLVINGLFLTLGMLNAMRPLKQIKEQKTTSLQKLTQTTNLFVGNDAKDN